MNPVTVAMGAVLADLKDQVKGRLWRKSIWTLVVENDLKAHNPSVLPL